MAQVRLNNLDIEKIQALVKEMQDNPQLYQDMANSGWNTRVQCRAASSTPSSPVN